MHPDWERRLWTAVLHQALVDAHHDTDVGEDARHFLRTRGELEPVCSAADIDVDWFQAALARKRPELLRGEGVRAEESPGLPLLPRTAMRDFMADLQERPRRRGSRPIIWTPEAIVQAEQEWIRTHLRAPTVNDYHLQRGLPSLSTLYRVCGRCTYQRPLKEPSCPVPLK